MDERDVRSWAERDFGLALVAVTPAAGGADTAATTWHATAAGGAEYAVKVRPAGPGVGQLVPAYLAGQGVAGLPVPLRSRSGGWWSVRDGAQLSVVPWIRGREGYPGGLDAAGWTALGALLGRAHAADVPPELRERLPQEDYRPPWVAAPRAVRLPPTARPADAPTEELREIWREVGTTLALLAERAEALGRELRARRPPPVLCHADPHLMNVLVDGGGQPWLIDWDDARMAPRECDLMFVVGGLFADQPVGARELTWFGRGYGDTRVDPALLAYYRCSRALEDIAGPAVEVLDPRRSPAERAASLANARFSLAPGGILTLALEALGTLERSLSKD